MNEIIQKDTENIKNVIWIYISRYFAMIQTLQSQEIVDHKIKCM